MRKIGVGVVGIGVAGTLHADSYDAIKDKARIIGICDSEKGRAEANAAIYGANPYTDYHKMLKNKDIEIIDVCLPHHMHANAAVAAAEAGKNVLVEKPIATTLKDADRIINAAKKSGVKLMVAENHAFVPAHMLVKKMVDKGQIGRIFLAKANEVVGDTPITPDSWRIKPEALGEILDMGVHRFFILRWLMGEVKSVFAFAGKLVCELECNFDDTAVIALKFKNGALGEIDITDCAISEPTNHLELYGTNGTILEDHMWEKPLMYFSNKIGYETEGWVRPKVEHEPFPGYYCLSFKNEVEHFVDCVLNDKKPKVSGEDGKAAIKIALSAYESVKTGKVVNIK